MMRLSQQHQATCRAWRGWCWWMQTEKEPRRPQQTSPAWGPRAPTEDKQHLASSFDGLRPGRAGAGAPQHPPPTGQRAAACKALPWVSSFRMFKATLCVQLGWRCDSHFTDEETEVQRDKGRLHPLLGKAAVLGALDLDGHPRVGLLDQSPNRAQSPGGRRDC